IICATTPKNENSLDLLKSISGNTTATRHYLLENGGSECVHSSVNLVAVPVSSSSPSTTNTGIRVGIALMGVSASPFYMLGGFLIVMGALVLAGMLYRFFSRQNVKQIVHTRQKFSSVSCEEEYEPFCGELAHEKMTANILRSAPSSLHNRKTLSKSSVSSMPLNEADFDATTGNHRPAASYKIDLREIDKLPHLDYANIKYNGPFNSKTVLPPLRRLTASDMKKAVEEYFQPHYNFIRCVPTVQMMLLKKPGKLIDCRLVSPLSTDEEKIVFYIPGTASVTRNTKIDELIALHLGFALNSQVLIVDHDLSPRLQWPGILFQICKIILDYKNKSTDKTCFYLAGFSSGGYFATLVPFILKDSMRFSRLILFAPMLDLGAELRRGNTRDWKDNIHKLPLPKSFKNTAKEKVARLDRLISLVDGEDFFEKDIGNLYECIILYCFPEFQGTPENLRKYSPIWFEVGCYTEALFPDITIIVGEKDCFRIDSELFYGKFEGTDRKIMKIVLPKINHGLIWKCLYPIYLAQKINTPEDMSDLDFKEILAADESLKVDKNDKSKTSMQESKETVLPERTILHRADHLKELCHRFNYQYSRRPNQPINDDAHDKPGYASHKLN
ncbi:MAG: hypothetical protein M3R00_00180, partial [Pseudomonadota bacterium]|nr:hypothetical protein [Pseudomonadota bacterium]